MNTYLCMLRNNLYSKSTIHTKKLKMYITENLKRDFVINGKIYTQLVF